ncbi:MAG: M56 family metallopeptidase [Lachnospiraceae bacterium]|nr:M56 family metallopeptidase [Lachnospiraceae bacterium]
MEGFFEWMLESSLLVVMILCIRRIFIGRIRYAAIYSLWLIVLLRFIIPVNFIPAPINIGNVFSNVILSGISSDSRDCLGEAADILPEDGVAGSAVQNESGIYSSGVLSKNDSNVAGDIPLESRRGTVWQYIISGSVIVSAVLLLWIIISNVNMLISMKKRRIFYGRRNGVNIYTVCSIDTPCLYGFLRPAIYIPEALVSDDGNGDADMRTRIGVGELEQIITHEYVHYIHRDHIWAAFRIVLISLYWFNPFLWAAVIYSKKDAELFCDETVLGKIGEENRIRYGEMLVRLAKDARWGDFRYSMTPMSRRGKEMEHRIRAISSRRRYSLWMMVPLILSAALSLGVTCGTGVMKVKDGGDAAIIQIPGILVNTVSTNLNGGNTGDAGISREIENIQPIIEDYENNTANEDVILDVGIISDDYEQAFSNYINVFTEAVNTGDTDSLHHVLLYGSPVYEQQCNIAKNYHNRGIREEVKSYAIVSINRMEDNRVEIISKEKIKVYYADNTSKLVKQEYKYTCENIDGSWIITEMSDIDGILDLEA